MKTYLVEVRWSDTECEVVEIETHDGWRRNAAELATAEVYVSDPCYFEDATVFTAIVNGVDGSEPSSYSVVMDFEPSFSARQLVTRVSVIHHMCRPCKDPLGSASGNWEVVTCPDCLVCRLTVEPPS